MKNLIKLLLLAGAISFVTPIFSQEDLSIRYIERLPKIDYVESSSNPAIDGWPSIGQKVTWSAKVKHWGTVSATVNYRWYIDGVEVGAGSRTIVGGTEVDITFVQNWTFNRKELKFVIDADNHFIEVEEGNNEITLFTDAISVGFYVEQGVYDYFHAHQNQLNSRSNNFEDWAHRQVRMWNDMFANAVTSGAPNGVLDRIRLDKITVVADGGLPLPGGSTGYPTNLPAIDKTIDLIWGFPTHHYLNNSNYFGNHTDANINNPFYFDGALFHELGHARYLIDVYGFNIESEQGQTINIQENGMDIDDAGLFPSPYWVNMPGLMNSPYTSIDEYSTLALNLIEGHRATCGNANSPCNIGSVFDGFMQDIPAQNRILISDSHGRPVPGANVQIYQAEPGNNTIWYSKRYDDTPDLTFTSNQYGFVYVGNNPFSSGIIEHTYGYSNGTIIIRAEKGNKVGYAALESFRFNMEYWRGHTNLGTYHLNFENIIGTPIGCPEDYLIYSHWNSDIHLEAKNTITSSAAVFSNEDIEYDAGTFVKLTPGFLAQPSSRFHAYVGGCIPQFNKDETIEQNNEIQLSNDPNPFTGQTTIEFVLPEDSPVTLYISDAMGRTVEVLLDNENKQSGVNGISFNGSRYPAGMYYYSIQAGEYSGTQKMLIIK